MKQGKTEIVVLLDRSGSMYNIKNDMEGALANFLDGQAKLPGECVVSTCLFNENLEINNVPRNVKTVPNIVLEPRGMTALYDAIGVMCAKVGERLSKTDESERPEKVLVVIITDGLENSSNEYNGATVKAAIETQTNQFNWEFVFIGANQDAVLTAQSMGISSKSSLSYKASAGGVGAMTRSLGAYTNSVRSGADASFTADDRDKAMQD